MSEHLLTLTTTLVVILVIAFFWRLYNRAVRVDRLHHRVLGARATLDAMLLYRATAVMELLSTGLLQGESKNQLAQAAQHVLHSELPIVDDHLEPDDERSDLPPVTWGKKLSTRLSSVLTEQAGSDESSSAQPSPSLRVTQENTLTDLIHQVLTDEIRQRAQSDPVQKQAVDNVDRAMYRLGLAMSFHNMHVLQAQRVRASWDARIFHLAGHAPMPEQCHLALDRLGE